MSSSPRESMDTLPRVFRPFFSWLTGMPTAHEEPLFLWSNTGRIIASSLSLGAGLAIGVFAWDAASFLTFLLLPVSWLITTSSARMLYVVIEHACTHNTGAKTATMNRLVGNTVSIVLWATPLAVFRTGHGLHHRFTREPRDPDYDFILGTGFRREMSKNAFWRYFLWTMISPTYHLKYVWVRITGAFSGSILRQSAVAVYAGLNLLILSVDGALSYWLVVWFVPIFPLFHISSFINYHTEHRWPTVHAKARNDLSYGRFCGEVPPVKDAAVSDFGLWIKWVVWWMRIVLVYLPYRVFVLVGDLPQHDLHHRNPGSSWANPSFARRDAVLQGATPKFEDVWGGLRAHVNASIRDLPLVTQTDPNLQRSTNAHT